MSQRRSYDAPMFLEPLPPSGARGSGEKQRGRVVVVAQAFCPYCRQFSRIGHTVALVRVGPHLAWREHWVTTGDGQRVQCRASSAGLCETGVNAEEHKRWAKAVPECTCTSDAATVIAGGVS